MKLQTHFSQNMLFICCVIFLKLWLSVCILNSFIRFQHASSFTFLVFKISLTILIAQPVSIFRAKLWKIVLKCETVIFLTFGFFSKCTFLKLKHYILSSTSWSSQFFSLIVCIHKIHVFDEAFFFLAIAAMATKNMSFSYF